MSQNLLQTMPALADKAVIDLINSINVSKDHINVQKSRTGKIARLMDTITGSGVRRQNAVNENLASGLNAIAQEIEAIIKNQTVGFYAIQKANDKINELNEGLASTIDFSIETRQLLGKLAADLNSRCDDLQKQIRNVDLNLQAATQIEHLFSKWDAGKLSMLSPMSRLYVVLDELYWGDFGNFYRQRDKHPEKVNKLINTIENKAITQLNRDLKITADSAAPTSLWFSAPKALSADLHEGLQFLGDWTNDFQHPLTHYSSQLLDKPPALVPPKLMASRVVTASLDEIFEERV